MKSGTASKFGKESNPEAGQADVTSPSKTGRKPGIYGIWRVDSDRSRTHCWVVRLQRRHRIWRRFFSDGAYGGKAKALRAARTYRDEILAAHPPMTRADYAAIVRGSNRSGVPGVCRYVATMKTLGKPVARAYWIAFWTLPNGKSARRKFSVAKHGEAGALKRAKAARRQALSTLNMPYVNSPKMMHWLRQHAQA